MLMAASHISHLFDEGLSLREKMRIKYEDNTKLKLNYISQEN